MPLIPILRPNTDVAKPGVPALDRERRPNVDARGIIAGMGDLADASKLPLVNPGPFVEAAGALGHAIGGALMQTGSVIGALANQRIKERERVALIEADSAMEIAGAELRRFQSKNPMDTASWVPYAEKLADDTLKRFSGDKRITGKGAEVFSIRAAAWRQKMLIDADTQGGAQDFRESRNATTGRAGALRAQGRIAEADAVLQDGSHLLFPSEMAAEQEANRLAGAQQDVEKAATFAIDPLHRDIAAARKTIEDSPYIPAAAKPYEVAKLNAGHASAVQKDELIAIAGDDPTAGLEALQDPKKSSLLSPGDKVQMRDAFLIARESMGDHALAKSKEFVAMLDTKKLEGMTPEALDAALANDKTEVGRMWKQATPFHKALAAEHLALKQGRAKVNDEANYLKTIAEIDGYAPGADATRIGASRLLEKISVQFDGAYKDQLMKRFESRGSSELPAITGKAMALVHQWAYRDNAAGPVNRPVLKDGKPVFRDAKKEAIGYTVEVGTVWDSHTPVKENDGNRVALTEVDPLVKGKVDELAALIGKRLDEAVKSGAVKTEDAAVGFVADQAIKLGWKPEARPVPMSVHGDVSPLPEGDGATGSAPLLVPAPTPDDLKKARAILKSNGANP